MQPPNASQPQPPPLPKAEPFRCLSSAENQSAHIRAIGELDLATVPNLRREIDALRGAGFRHLTLDLSRLDFIDSAPPEGLVPQTGRA